MNQKEWKKSGKFPGKYKWYNLTRKFQRSLCYEQDPNATVIHHLRDTEEQRKYNDEHYELWGFEIDENGYLIENIQNADYPYSFGVDEISGQLYIET